MDDILSMTMIDSLEERFHIPTGNFLRECLVLLLGDFLEKLRTRHILHDQVDVLLIVVSFVILDDIWVIKWVQNVDLFHDAVDIVSQFDFVQHLDSNLEITVMLILSLEHTSKGANSKHLSFRIDMIVLFQLMHTLLFVALACLESHTSVSCVGLAHVSGLNRLTWVNTTHFYYQL